MLMMRVTPKMSDKPAPTRNRLDAAARPLSAWNRRASRVMRWRGRVGWVGAAEGLRKGRCSSARNPTCLRRGMSGYARSKVTAQSPGCAALTQSRHLFAAPSIHRSRRTQLLHLFVGGQYARAVDIFEVGHRPLAVLERDLADIGAQRRLVVVGAELERPERAFDPEAAEGGDELVGIGRARLGNAGGKRVDGVVADH